MPSFHVNGQSAASSRKGEALCGAVSSAFVFTVPARASLSRTARLGRTLELGQKAGLDGPELAKLHAMLSKPKGPGGMPSGILVAVYATVAYDQTS